MSLKELYLNPDPYAFSGNSVSYQDSIFVVVGVPFDSTSSYKPGSRFGPRAIREASINIESNGVLAKRSYIESVKIHDAGDIAVVPGDSLETLRRVSAVIGEIVKENKIPIILGGEHTITYGVIKGILLHRPRPCLIVFDAHFDLREDYLGYKYSHASVMRRIIEANLASKIIYLGVRGYEEEEVKFAEEKEGKILYKTPLDIERDGIRNTIMHIRRFLSDCQTVYLSIDIDGIDPAFAPGTGTPEPFGLSPIHVVRIIHGVLDERLTGLDLVEVNPMVDCNDVTSILGARIVQEALLVYKYGGVPGL